MDRRVGVVGGGIMGAGIAEVCARAGAEVVLAEVEEQRASHALDSVRGSLDRAVAKGKIRPDDAERAGNRVRAVADLSELHDRRLVIEAIVEDESAKSAVFERLDRILDDDSAILASNTSSIPIMKLAMATRRRERVVGLHFFNPVPVLGLVEIVPSLLTSRQTVHEATRFVEGLGKHAIQSQDRAGFIVNALLVPYILSAIRMLESGFATVDDIESYNWMLWMGDSQA